MGALYEKGRRLGSCNGIRVRKMIDIDLLECPESTDTS
jgi:hypothetical protein